MIGPLSPFANMTNGIENGPFPPVEAKGKQYVLRYLYLKVRITLITKVKQSRVTLRITSPAKASKTQLYLTCTHKFQISLWKAQDQRICNQPLIGDAPAGLSSPEDSVHHNTPNHFPTTPIRQSTGLCSVPFTSFTVPPLRYLSAACPIEIEIGIGIGIGIGTCFYGTMIQ